MALKEPGKEKDPMADNIGREDPVARTAQGWTESAAEALRTQAQDLGAMMQLLAEQAQQQQQALQKLAEDSMNAYMELLNIPASFISEQAQQQQQQLQQSFQQLSQQWMPPPEQQQQQFQQLRQMSQQWMNSYMNLLNAQLSYFQEAGRRAQDQLPISNYDNLSIEEVSKELDSLSVDEIEELKDYEKRHKNRQTLIKEFDRRLTTAS